MTKTAGDELPTILVFDEDKTRGLNICDELISAGARAQRFYDKAGIAKAIHQGTKCPEWDLALVHGTDSNTFGERRIDLGRVKRIIYYSGTGGRDAHIPFRAQRIFRGIAVNASPITEHEAQELVKAAREHGHDPSFLMEPTTLPVLRSLSVLTALYLGVRASCSQPGIEIHLGDWQPVTASILESIGWTKLPDSLRQELSNQNDGLPSRRIDVRRASWWLERLPVHQGPALETAVEKELTEATARRGINPEAVRALVAELKDGQNTAIATELVETCYFELAAFPEF